MADLTITAANVISGSGSKIDYGKSVATIVAGKAVYLDAADKYQLSDSNSATAAVRAVDGISLNGASDGQPIAVHKSGPLTMGATLSAGATYYLSETPGGIQPGADLTTGEYPTVIGVATSTTVLNVKIQSAGVAI